MVEIELNSRSQADQQQQRQRPNDEEVVTESHLRQTDKRDLDEVDMELVGQVREMLRAERSEKYAINHYDDIMDPLCPLTCWRYLKHCKREPKEAFELIKTTLVWRKEHVVDEIKSADFAKEFWLQAPIGFTGPSRDGNQVFYIIGKNYHKPAALFKDTIKSFCMHTLFGWDKRHQHDLSQYIFVFDVSDTGYNNIDLDFMGWLVSIRDYIPARINKIYVVGIPYLVRPFVRLIISWLPEKFSRLVHCGTFEQLVEANIDSSSLPVEVGGTSDETYRLAPPEAPWLADSAVYSQPDMLKAMKDCIGFNLTEADRERLREMQVSYENRLSKQL